MTFDKLENPEQLYTYMKNNIKYGFVSNKDFKTYARKELNNIKGEHQNIDFGSQIRSYVMHPYSMVKDHRTKEETSDVSKVLDGDLTSFMITYLKTMS